MPARKRQTICLWCQKTGTANKVGFNSGRDVRLASLLNYIYNAGQKSISLYPEDAQRRMEETLRANAARPLFSGTAVSLSTSH